MQHNHLAEFKSLPRVILLLLLIVAISACSTATKVESDLVLQSNDSTQATTATTVSGFIVENDGVTPVYGATIAALSSKIEIKDSHQRTENNYPCVSPSKPNINFVCTNEDGSFTLDLAQVREFPVMVSIEKDDEIQEITLDLTDLNSHLGIIAIAPEAVNLKDKVAVVMDFYNPIKEIQQFLSNNPTDTNEVALQLMSEYQNLFEINSSESEISYPTFYSLFMDADEDGKADIFNYDIVYINSRQQSDLALLDESLRNKLLNFISNGGNLYITEWTVELEQEEPSLDQYI